MAELISRQFSRQELQEKTGLDGKEMTGWIRDRQMGGATSVRSRSHGTDEISEAGAPVFLRCVYSVDLPI
jgi:hypothetical protein